MSVKPNIPKEATVEDVRQYIRWMDSVIGIGWRDKDLQGLSDLWWKHHPPVEKGEVEK